ncbi:MAG: hypothetical protein LBB38_00485 [Puniceicoccales bacterium]|jgi:hypothetical protein|nr:hypothetical protein [Puniceicoccales bacterium]
MLLDKITAVANAIEYYTAPRVRRGPRVEEIDCSDDGTPVSRVKPRITEPGDLMETATGVLHSDAEAHVILSAWKFSYPEEMPWICAEERRLKIDGVSLCEAEAHISGEMQVRKLAADERLAERKQLIADPKTRSSVVPRNEGGRMEIDRLNEIDRLDARAAANEAQAARTMAQVKEKEVLVASKRAALDDGSYARARRAEIDAELDLELAEQQMELEMRRQYVAAMEAVIDLRQ